MPLFGEVLQEELLSERYFDERAMEFYGLQLGSMTNDEYTRRLLGMLRYVPYLKEEKAKFKRFISGLPVAYRYQIKFDEPRSLEEAIQKLK